VISVGRSHNAKRFVIRHDLTVATQLMKTSAINRREMIGVRDRHARIRGWRMLRTGQHDHDAHHPGTHSLNLLAAIDRRVEVRLRASSATP
jgi:hypothetical protein